MAEMEKHNPSPHLLYIILLCELPLIYTLCFGMSLLRKRNWQCSGFRLYLLS